MPSIQALRRDGGSEALRMNKKNLLRIQGEEGFPPEDRREQT